jgi:hypothetical protein
MLQGVAGLTTNTDIEKYTKVVADLVYAIVEGKETNLPISAIDKVACAEAAHSGAQIEAEEEERRMTVFELYSAALYTLGVKSGYPAFLESENEFFTVFSRNPKYLERPVGAESKKPLDLFDKDQMGYYPRLYPSRWQVILDKPLDGMLWGKGHDAFGTFWVLANQTNVEMIGVKRYLTDPNDKVQGLWLTLVGNALWKGKWFEITMLPNDRIRRGRTDIWGSCLATPITKLSFRPGSKDLWEMAYGQMMPATTQQNGDPGCGGASFAGG